MMENDEKPWKMSKKIPFPSCAFETHEEKQKKSLLVSDKERLPKTGCSFGFLLFFDHSPI